MLLSGKEVTDALNTRLRARTDTLRQQGTVPTLGMIRVGEAPGDLSYERGVTKRAELVGVEITKQVLRPDCSKEDVLSAIDRFNADKGVHGVLMFRPLPQALKPYQTEICNRLDPKKDVDGMTHMSAAGVFQGLPLGFAPCTAAACIEILDHYGIDCEGKNAVVIGRSMVVGKPVAMMLTGKNATVTLCHTRTRDLARVCRGGDILITAAGSLGFVNEEFVRPGQIVIDVSINWDEKKGGISGDVRFDSVSQIVDAITPVPGGVGSVTTSVLLEHVVTAAEAIRNDTKE